jgi:hypothetical protein
LAKFHALKTMLDAHLIMLKKTCFVCQSFESTKEAHEFKNLEKVLRPLQSWSIDVITDLPETKKKNRYILLAVDDYCSFVVVMPMKDNTSESIIEVLERDIILRYDTPQVFRSDEQASIYNSKKIYSFLDQYGIRLQTTAVAAPFSNARAESQIKNIKHMARKFLYQENALDQWDEYILQITHAHNKSVNTYGLTPHQLMFGQVTPSKVDLLKTESPLVNQTDYLTIVLPKAVELREKAKRLMLNKAKENRTFKNKDRTDLKITVGSLVNHRQCQVSTGPSTSWKPLFTGPYVVDKIHRNGQTCMMTHLHTGTSLKAHFVNLQHYNFVPERIQPSKNSLFDVKDLLDEKYSLNKFSKEKFVPADQSLEYETDSD